MKEKGKYWKRLVKQQEEKYADRTTGNVRFENEAILIVGRK